MSPLLTSMFLRLLVASLLQSNQSNHILIVITQPLLICLLLQFGLMPMTYMQVLILIPTYTIKNQYDSATAWSRKYRAYLLILAFGYNVDR